MERKMFYDATHNAFEKARWLRNNPTKHEQMLWSHLRQNKIFGVRIKRQHPIGTYIADFYCHQAKLVIEVDGASHNSAEQKVYDEEREFNIKLEGLKIIRFSNEEVENNISNVIAEITKEIKQRMTNN